MSDSRRLAQELYEIRSLALSHATSPQLGVSSVDGEGLVFRDGDGNDLGRIGGDGNGVEFEYLYGPKPPQPSAPDVSADTNLLSVRWDGLWADQSETDPDIVGSPVLDRVEVHVSSDENFVPDPIESFAGTMPVLDSGGQILVGPLAEAGDWYVVLLARGKDGQYGAPSDRVHVVTTVGLVENELFDLALRAGEAMESADGKNSVYYGDTEPEPLPRLDEDGEPVLDGDGNPLFNEFTEGDIWFGPGNMPHVWSETDGWVSAADERVDAIQSAVEDLESALDDVVVGAGGTKNFYQTEPPAADDDPAPAEGDLWFDQNDQNKPYIFRDGEWVSIRDDSFLSTAKDLTPWAPHDPNPHALDGAVAEMDVAFEVGPDAVPIMPSYTVARLKTNASHHEDVLSYANVRLPFQGGYVSASSDEMTFDATAIPFEGRTVTSRIILGAVFPFPLALGPRVTLNVSLFDIEGAHVATLTQRQRLTRPEPGSTLDLYGFDWGFEGALTREANASQYPTARYMTLGLEFEVPRKDGVTMTLLAAASYVQVSGDSIAEGSITETKIAPDSIATPHLQAEVVTAEKIATGTITAESGIIGSLDAGKITVGELDGARIKAGSIQADLVLIEGSVGSTLIREGAVTTDKIQAGAVTTEKITAGGIDAGVITTGELRGELIRAESIAASALAADAIDGKTITGATVRTAAAGARVEMDSTGLYVKNQFGLSTVSMTNGELTVSGGTITGGTIRTSASGARVQLDVTGLKAFNPDGEETFVVSANTGAVDMLGNLRQVNSYGDLRVGPAVFASGGAGSGSPAIALRGLSRPSGINSAGISLREPTTGGGSFLNVQGEGAFADGWSYLYLASPDATMDTRLSRDHGPDRYDALRFSSVGGALIDSRQHAGEGGVWMRAYSGTRDHPQAFVSVTNDGGAYMQTRVGSNEDAVTGRLEMSADGVWLRSGSGNSATASRNLNMSAYGNAYMNAYGTGNDPSRDAWVYAEQGGMVGLRGGTSGSSRGSWIGIAAEGTAQVRSQSGDVWLSRQNASGSTTWSSISLTSDGIRLGLANSTSYGVYMNTLPSNTGAVPIGRVSGQLYAISSSRKYKLMEEPIGARVEDFEDKLLSIEAKTWVDRGAAERLADYYTAVGSGEEPERDLDDIAHLNRIPGVVAEDLEAAGLSMFVHYEDGEPEAVLYDRIGPALIPIVRGLRDRINELEEKIGEWENG